jgi:ABC-2 type transport system permease protein
MTTADEATSALQLRRLRGPELVGGRRRFVSLWWRLTKTDWSVRYQGSVLGVVWAFLGPLLFALVLYAAFSRFLRFGGDIPNYQEMLIVNIMIFGIFTEGTSRALSSFINRGAVIRQLELPRLAIPLAAIGTTTLTVGMALVAALGLILVLGVGPLVTWLLIPALIAGFLVVVVPLGLILAVLNARLRDVSQVWTAISRAMFYASPVLFPIELYPDSWKAILYWNPLAPLLATTRQWVVDPDAPSYGEALGGNLYWLGPIAVTLVIIVASFFIFRRRAPQVAEDL